MNAVRLAIYALLLFQATDASAVTVEVAKTCNALLAKKFPPRQPGNPAAGSAQGSGKVQRDYFRKCVDSGGKIDDSDTKPK